MTREELIGIFNNGRMSDLRVDAADKALEGLKILAKYKNGIVLCGAGHEKIFSLHLDEIVKLGITREDVLMLVSLNWHINEEMDCLCSFV